jgi:hypothetical protein
MDQGVQPSPHGPAAQTTLAQPATPKGKPLGPPNLGEKPLSLATGPRLGGGPRKVAPLPYPYISRGGSWDVHQTLAGIPLVA